MVFKKIYNLINCSDIKKLYEESFPKNERTNFYNLLSGVYSNFEIYALYNKNIAVAFVHLNFTVDFVHINYFAVSEFRQGHGVGSLFLEWLKNKYKNTPLVLDVETENKKIENNFDRIRRIDFYKKNGFILSDYKIKWQNEYFSPMYYGSLNINKFKNYIKKLLLQISKID